MKFCRLAVLVVPLMLPAIFARAEDDDQPFAEEQQGAEFKQMETKQEEGRLNPPAVVAPGPEGGASPILFRDRLMVLRDARATAVQQKKSPAEIAQIDAQIKSIQEQLVADGAGN
jgi:hypothetical protein